MADLSDEEIGAFVTQLAPQVGSDGFDALDVLNKLKLRGTQSINRVLTKMANNKALVRFQPNPKSKPRYFSPAHAPAAATIILTPQSAGSAAADGAAASTLQPSASPPPPIGSPLAGLAAASVGAGAVLPSQLSDSLVEDAVRFHLRRCGRTQAGVTAKEMKKQIYTDVGLWLEKKSINRALQTLCAKKMIKSVLLPNENGGADGSKLWSSTELELTSVDEIEAFVALINSRLLDEAGRSSVLAKEFRDKQPMLSSITHQYEEQHVVVNGGDSSGSAVGPLPYRFQGRVVLSPEPKDFQPNPISFGSSKACMQSEVAKIRAYHDLLAQLSTCRVLSAKQQKECRARYVEAYRRGRSWQVGDRLLALQEDYWTEFKGMDANTFANGTRVWPHSAFMTLFKEHTVPSLCSYINTSLLLNQRPLLPARILFGVTDDGDLTGVSRTVDLKVKSPDSYQQELQQELLEWLREKIEHRVENKLSHTRDKLLAAVAVRVQALHVPNELRDKFQSATPFLVEVTLNFEHQDLTHLQPACYIEPPDSKATKDAMAAAAARGSAVPAAASYSTASASSSASPLDCWTLFVRSAKPARLVASRDELDQLFAMGRPNHVTFSSRD